MLAIHVFNVGLGDSIILETKIGDKFCYSIIDCKKVGTTTPIVKFLKENNIKNIHSLFLTHFHADHCSGLPQLRDYLLENKGTLEFFISPYLSDERDDLLDVDGRNRVLDEARQIIHEIHNLAFDAVGKAQADQIMAEARVQLLKKRKEAQGFVNTAESYSDTEMAAAIGEESAAMLVALTLPEERLRIQELLARFPGQSPAQFPTRFTDRSPDRFPARFPDGFPDSPDRFPDGMETKSGGMETKSAVLINALRQIWQQNPHEKVVIFATYLATMEVIRRHIEEAFPDRGVAVLKGGDHGAKTAAQKRFRRKDGPKVLICTAAGREGINLQFARILFNYDLPWNPMDLEQRIGRIHRYGQQSTAQVYNLVAADTIEGQIFLMLEEKLRDIACTLGKVDDHGQVAEDLRAQVLGQLSSCLSYDRLYQDALADPTLKRTRQELEVAMTNANLARQVVFELFQDLDRFNLGDYRKFDDEGRGMQRLIAFLSRAARLSGQEFRREDETRWSLIYGCLIQEGKIAAGGRAALDGAVESYAVGDCHAAKGYAGDGYVGEGRHAAIQFTSDRNRAMQEEKLDLLGLEHPVIRAYMQSYRELGDASRALVGKICISGKSSCGFPKSDAPKSGIAKSDIQEANIPKGDIPKGSIPENGVPKSELPQCELPKCGLLTVWRIHTNTQDGRASHHVVRIAITQDGERAPWLEREILHRELIYSGIISEEMSYSATLLAMFGIEW
jgi:hypothetical protein